MGGGGNPIKEAERSIRDTARKWKKNPWNEFLRVVSNYSTAGIAERKTDGSWGAGGASRSTNEIGEAFSGGIAKRQERYKTDDMMRTMEAQNELDRKNKELADYRADLQASQSVEGIRNTAAARVKGVKKLGTDEDEDVLGI